MYLLRIFIGSFYNPATYRTAMAPQNGTYLFYSFLLVLLSATVLAVSAISFVDRTLMEPHGNQAPLLDRFLTAQAAQLPPFTIHNGVLSTKVKQPYRVALVDVDAAPEKTSPEKHKDDTWIVFDTTGATNVHNMTAPILVTAREIYARSNQKTEVYTLDQFMSATHAPLIVNHAVITDSTQRVINWLHTHRLSIYAMGGIPMWLGASLVFYVLRLLMLLALGAVAMVMSHIFNRNMDFAAALRVSSVAYTPVAVSSTVALGLTSHSPGSLILLALGSVMLLAGFLATRERPRA